MGGLQVSIDNPETYGGNSIYTILPDTANDNVHDFIAKYIFKGDWGNVSISGLARQLESKTGNTESAIGYGLEVGQFEMANANDLSGGKGVDSFYGQLSVKYTM